MSDKRVTASARVRVTLDIVVTDSWGRDCAAGQIFDQAGKSALHDLRRAFQQIKKEFGYHVVVCGEPEVTAVLAKERCS